MNDVQRLKDAGFSYQEIKDAGYGEADVVATPEQAALATKLGNAGFTEEEIFDHIKKSNVAPKPTTPAQPQKQGFVGKINDSLVKRGVNIADELTPKVNESIGGTLLKAPERALRITGQAAGLAGDVIGRGIGSIIDTVTPESVQTAVKAGVRNVLDTSLGKMGMEAAKGGYDTYQSFKKSYPNVAKDLEASVNIASMLPIGKAGQIGLKGAKEGVNIARDVGTITGASKIPGKVIDATKNFIKPTPTKDEALGQILQGKTKDIAKGEKALSSIDTKGVKSYEDLSGKLKEGISNYARQVDDELLKDTKVYTIDELSTVSKTKGGQVVEKNYVQDALSNLDELYGKTGDAVKQAEIGELLNKATAEGLTKKEVNDLARQYGIEFKSKAFGKLGDPLTSVNAQMYENTRAGLKEVSRRGLSQKAKDLDSTISSLYNTDRLVSETVEKVNKLRQKIDERGLGEKIGRHALDVMDMATMGMVKGAALRLFPRGLGYKVKNFIDLEDSLGRNLKIFSKALDAKNDIEMVNTLKSNFGKYVAGKMDSGKIPLAKESESVMMSTGEKPHEWIKNQLNQLQSLSQEAGTITPGEITKNQRDIASRINNELRAKGLSASDKKAVVQGIDSFFSSLNLSQKEQLKNIIMKGMTGTGRIAPRETIKGI